ncbi:hypothetical protein [Thiomicrorhabdus cannonii]|uniref:hypothetical protein n=1 Tax=Thiomicrorhabdus cannonii TaxID=2748011 RepID=UPI0015C0B29C|nr:hypothetical protein [Thiomicrorhabdus cannonii]
MFGKLIMLFLLVGLIALAVMFDWFGSRDLALQGLDGGKVVVEKLAEVGDSVSHVLETMHQDKDKP